MARFVFAGLLIVFTLHAQASLITVDPDDFAAGDIITGTSTDYDIRTIDGGNVYSAPLIGEGQATPENFTDSGPIGERVFSESPTKNLEWQYPTLDLPRAPNLSELKEDVTEMAFMVEFFRPVSYVSIYNLEIFPDAGFPFGGDPMRIFLFAPNGGLIVALSSDYKNKTFLPGTVNNGEPAYAYFKSDFSFPEIGYLVMAGDSEATTIDRLQFRYAKVPEPATLSLLALGLAAIGIRRRYS